MSASAGWVVGEFLGPVPDRRGQQQFPAGRRPQPVVGPADAALVGDLEVADLLDRVAEELHPQRVLLGRREDVDDAAAHRDLAAGARPGRPGSSRSRPAWPAGHRARRPVALVQADRLQVTEAGHDGLQQAAHRGDHHRERPVRLARLGRVGEPPQHRDPPPDRVGLRGEPLMRQGLPAGEAGHAARGQERAEGRGQVVGLAGGGGDREHEAVGSVGPDGSAPRPAPAAASAARRGLLRRGWRRSARRPGMVSDSARETTSCSCGSSSRMVSSPARLMMSL